MYKEGIGKYIATDPAPPDPKGKSGGEGGEAATGPANGGKDKAAAAPAAAAPAADADDMWANAVPVKKAKAQPKAGFGDFSSW